jgi:hypothetical protein
VLPLLTDPTPDVQGTPGVLRAPREAWPDMAGRHSLATVIHFTALVPRMHARHLPGGLMGGGVPPVPTRATQAPAHLKRPQEVQHGVGVLDRAKPAVPGTGVVCIQGWAPGAGRVAGAGTRTQVADTSAAAAAGRATA